MGSSERIEFLKNLDSAIWVEKRLFPARLLVLDEIESNHESEDSIKTVVPYLISEDKDNVYLTKDLAELAIIAHKELAPSPAKIAETPVNENSSLEQFLSDLVTYGLREALAYIFEDQGIEVGMQFEKLILKSYSKIGNRFIANSEKIKQRLKATYSAFIKNKPAQIPGLVDRLIIIESIKFCDPWGDGQRQNNLALVDL